MRRLSILLIILIAAFCALAFEAAPQTEMKEKPQVDKVPTIKEVPMTWRQLALGDGEDLYAEICAVCHGVDAKGDGPASPALTVPAPDLTLLAWHNGGVYPKMQVRKAITGETRIAAHGTQQMPIWGRIFKDLRPDMKVSQREGFAQLRIYDLVEYLGSLQATDKP